MKKSRIVILIIVFLLACGSAVFATVKYCRKHIAAEIIEKEVVIEKEVEITGEIIKSGLQDIGELATEEYYFTGVETYDSTKTIKGFNVPFTKSTFIYSYDGKIKAGIDFSQIDVEKDDLTKIITISVPAAHILSSEIYPESFQLYDEKNSIFNPISVSDVNDTILELKQTSEQDAIKKGLLKRADENAALILKNFLSGFDLSDYTIRTEIKDTE